MLLPHPAVTEAVLTPFLVSEFGCLPTEPRFLPCGEDSWAYRYGDLFVSVRRDLRGHNSAAYECARRLADAGAEYLVAPLRGRSGAVVHTLHGLRIVVFPYIPSVPLSQVGTSRGDVGRMLAVLADLHASPPALTEGLTTEDFTFSFDGELDAAAARSGSDLPLCGPFDAPLRRELAWQRESIEALRAEAAEIATQLRADPPHGVLTHGEPSAQNWIRAGDRLLLVDWGSARRGPVDRDLFHVARTTGVHVEDDPATQRFYELRWQLSEIAEYSSVFSNGHDDNAETRAMWQRLEQHLPAGVRA